MLLFAIIFILSFVLIISNWSFFKQCPYCNKRYCRKTPDIYSCNMYRPLKKIYNSYGNVCYHCYKYNKNVIHDID